MFNLAFELLNTGEEKTRGLDMEAESQITTRGYKEKAKVPPELSNSNFFLAVSEIAYDYCPTNRYLYFKKVENKAPKKTWASYKGSIIDHMIPLIYNETKKFITSKSLRNIALPSDLISALEGIVEGFKQNFKPASLCDPPNKTEQDKFFGSLILLAKHEGLMASAFLSNRIANVYGINISDEFNVLFPYGFKIKLSAPELGISGEAEPDFLVGQRILGEIKSQKWFSFYNIALAAYALAFEFDKKKNANLGLVLCPIFVGNRKLPMYYNRACLRVISESSRKTFLVKRNKRIKFVMDALDPGRASTCAECQGCGYYDECW
jgi:CRISPR-associated protein Csa1